MNLLRDQRPVEQIVRWTGLAREEVLLLQKSLQIGEQVG